LTQYDAVLGYNKDDLDVFVKHTANPKAKAVGPGVLGLQALYRNKDNRFALTAEKDLADQAPIKSVEVGGAFKVDDKTDIKAKINNDLALGLSAKYKHNSAYTFTVGANVPCKTIGKSSGSGLLPFDLGCQVDLNVWLNLISYILFHMI